MGFFKAMFVTSTGWGMPFKFLLVLLSVVTLPIGVALWGVLAAHGLAVMTERAARKAAKAYGLEGEPIASGDGSGFILDKKGRRLVIFSGLSEAEPEELPFDAVDSWTWQWLEKNGRRTENKLVFKTNDERRPVVTVGDFGAAAAEHWHERLHIVLAREPGAAARAASTRELAS